MLFLGGSDRLRRARGVGPSPLGPALERARPFCSPRDHRLLYTVRNGLVHRFRTSHAATLSAVAGFFEDIGMSCGKTRTPARYSLDGNGASYARASASVSLRPDDRLTISPTGIHGLHRVNALQMRISPRLVSTPLSAGSRPLPIAIRLNRASLPAANLNPMLDPQSWPNRVMVHEVQSLDQGADPANVPGDRIVVLTCWFVGLSKGRSDPER